MNIKKFTFLNTNYIYIKTFTTRIICERKYYSSQMKALFDDPDLFLKRQTKKNFKKREKDRSTVALVIVDNQPLIIKRYNATGVWGCIKLLFKPSRAIKSWINSNRLLELNISTAVPVAVIENRFGILRGESYFISVYIDGVDGGVFFREAEKYQNKYDRLIKNLADIMKKFTKHKITHGDLKHNNFIIADDQPYLIDLDRMQQHRRKNWLYRREHKRDVEILLKYPKNNPEVRAMIKEALTK